MVLLSSGFHVFRARKGVSFPGKFRVYEVGVERSKERRKLLWFLGRVIIGHIGAVSDFCPSGVECGLFLGVFFWSLLCHA